MTLQFSTLPAVSIALRCENTTRGAGILGEHGLSWWIESGGQHLLFALGGMHLLHGSTERMRRTIEALRAIALDWIAPKHCTGDAAMAELCTGDAAMAELCMAFRSQYLECHAGQRFTFPKSNNPST